MITDVIGFVAVHGSAYYDYPAQQPWSYLAVVMDLYPRRISEKSTPRKKPQRVSNIATPQ